MQRLLLSLYSISVTLNALVLQVFIATSAAPVITLSGSAPRNMMSCYPHFTDVEIGHTEIK